MVSPGAQRMATIDLPPAVLLPFTGLLGLAIGSFLTVVIRRLPTILERRWLDEARTFFAETDEQGASNATSEKLSMALPPSHCPACKKKLAALHKIPIVSYLFLRGKCGFCKAPISRQYPLVELLALLVSLVIVARMGLSLQSLAALVFSWVLIALSFIDINRRLLPDELTLGLLWTGLAASSQTLFASPTEAIFGALAGYAALWLVYHVMRLATGRKGMGYGDMKLLAAIGAWCGWLALPVILLMASTSGLLVSVILLLTGKMQKNDPISFGPYLAIAAWLFFTYTFIYEWPQPLAF